MSDKDVDNDVGDDEVPLPSGGSSLLAWGNSKTPSAVEPYTGNTNTKTQIQKHKYKTQTQKHKYKYTNTNLSARLTTTSLAKASCIIRHGDQDGLGRGLEHTLIVHKGLASVW